MDLTTQLYATRGGVTAVARKLGISDAAVSQWKTRGIPQRRLGDVQAALSEHLAAIGAAGLPVTPADHAAADAGSANHDAAREAAR